MSTSRPRRAAHRLAVVLTAALALLGVAAVAVLWWSQQEIADTLGDVQRIEGVFDGPEDPAGAPAAADPATRGTGRPAPAGSGEEAAEGGPGEEDGSGRTARPGPVQTGETFLLVGSDARGRAQRPGEGAWRAGSQRSDVMMLGRVGDDGTVVLVSLPRDLWVDVPGYGMNKLNAAYSFGGPNLLLRTLERQTGVRVDHFAMIDFQGVVALTDAIGGVTITSPRDSTYQGYDFVEGVNHLDGQAALAFMRQRTNLPRGDLDRVENQQRYLRALFGQVLSRQTAQDPSRMDAVLDAVLDYVAVDAETSVEELQTMARALGSTPDAQVVAGTVPTAGVGRERGQSVVYLDRDGATPVWNALRTGDVSDIADLL